MLPTHSIKIQLMSLYNWTRKAHTQKQGWMGRKLYANLTDRGQDPK